MKGQVGVVYGIQVRLESGWRSVGSQAWSTLTRAGGGPTFAYQRTAPAPAPTEVLFQLGSGQLESVNETPTGSTRSQ
jgi:hypothetical protein